MALSMAGRLLGADFAVDPQTNQLTTGWIALTLPLSFIGAMLGGWMAASIARAKALASVRALASLVLVLGLWMAFTTRFLNDGAADLVVDAPGATAGAMADAAPGSDGGAMRQPEPPVWFAFLTPLLGFTGVMIGGTIRRRASAG